MERSQCARVIAKPRLRMERITHGHTQDSFAKAIGYRGASAYGKLELQKNGARPQIVMRILEVLGVEFDDVFEFVDDEWKPW